MTRIEFQAQISRLEKQFGAYGMERAILLWDKVSHLTEKWFKNSVDSKIAYSRLNPLPSDFDADIDQERDRMRRIEKEQFASDAKQFWDTGWGTFPNDEKAQICMIIKKRAMNQVTDEEWASFCSSLKNAANSAPKENSATTANGGGE